MNETELCRLCVNVANQANAENIFEKNQRTLLQQIEELIGQRLKNSKDLPQQICKPCEVRTLQAHEFRAQCIRAQQHFTLQQKRQINEHRKLKLNHIYPAIEEVDLNGLHLVKEEERASPLAQITEVLFKHEPMHLSDQFDGDDDSEDTTFNPLEDDYQSQQHTMDDAVEDKKEDLMTIIPDEGLKEKNEDLMIVPDEVIKEKNEDLMIVPDEVIKEKNEDLMTILPDLSLFAKDEKPLLKEITATVKPKSNTKRKRNSGAQNSSTAREKNFICDQCGRHFVCNSMLDTHMRRHTGERMFKCEICPESFFLNADLKRHILKHAGILPYPCSHCDRRFLDKSHAKKHERTHTNERPFVCQQCGKAFTVSHILQDHMVTHTGERAFGCKLCNVAFKRKTHLITHYRSMTHKQNEEKLQMINYSYSQIAPQEETREKVEYKCNIQQAT